jgi:hypothetical protein
MSGIWLPAVLYTTDSNNEETYSHCFLLGKRRGRDRIEVGFTTTYGINAYHH